MSWIGVCCLLIPLAGSELPAALPLSAIIAGPQLSDSRIDGVGESVMKGNDFRSVRRRVLEQIPGTDADRGFLVEVMNWTSEVTNWIFDAIGGFFRWIGRLLSFSSAQRSTSAPAPSSDGSLLAAGMSGLTTLLSILAVVGVLLVVVVIASMILKSAEQRRLLGAGLLLDGEEDPGALSIPPGELAVSTYESRALQLAAEGNFRAAIRELLLGSMSWIERAGLIRYRKGLTNRDYVRAVWRRTPKRDAYAETALEFERVYFGRRTATAQSFESCLHCFRGAFREEEPVAAI